MEVRSQSGEKGSPSSASLSPWEEKTPQSWEGWGDKWLQWEKGMLPFDLEMRGVVEIASVQLYGTDLTTQAWDQFRSER